MFQVTIDDEGHIWWNPVDGEPQLLIDCDDLCGVGFLNTGVDDPFRDCCAWHDNAYQMRAFFEERGWNRKKIDDYFRNLMYKIAGSDIGLFYRANTFYHLVRMFGWIFYYRHPGFDDNRRDSECKLQLREIRRNGM